jgi:hypothetical protein
MGAKSQGCRAASVGRTTKRCPTDRQETAQGVVAFRRRRRRRRRRRLRFSFCCRCRNSYRARARLRRPGRGRDLGLSLGCVALAGASYFSRGTTPPRGPPLSRSRRGPRRRLLHFVRRSGTRAHKTRNTHNHTRAHGSSWSGLHNKMSAATAAAAAATAAAAVATATGRTSLTLCSLEVAAAGAVVVAPAVPAPGGYRPRGHTIFVSFRLVAGSVACARGPTPLARSCKGAAR